MTFWLIVAAILVVVLALIWWGDRRRRAERTGPVRGPEHDRSVQGAKADVQFRDLKGGGPGDGL